MVCIRLQIKCHTKHGGKVQHCCRGKPQYGLRAICMSFLSQCWVFANLKYFQMTSVVWKPDLPLPEGTGVLSTFSAGPSPSQVLSGVLHAATLLGALRECWGTAPRPNLQVTMTCHPGHTSACPPAKHRCQRRSQVDQG